MARWYLESRVSDFIAGITSLHLLVRLGPESVSDGSWDSAL